MKVRFELRFADGRSNPGDDQEVELSESELVALFNSEIITYPRQLGGGSTTSVRTQIEKKEFSMFDIDRRFLKVVLREVEL